MYINIIQKEINASIQVKNSLINSGKILSQINKLAEDCICSLKSGGKIIFFGNGGSFADAQHLSAEFTSRFNFDRKALASIALGTNNSALSAIGNDYGFSDIFSREIEANAKQNDYLIGISTSGKSQNIIKAIKTSNSLGLPSTIFTGQSGGSLKSITNCIKVPSSETARIQECHILIGHIVCKLVEQEMFKDDVI